MNIGLFTDTYYPELNGVANSVYLLKKELESKGHNVYVITTKTPGAPAKEENVFRVPSKSVSFVPERRLGMAYHPKIAHKIHKMKLDVIHTHTEFAIGMFGRIMARELFVPVVHTYHTIYEDYTHYLKKYLSSEEQAKKFARMYSKFSVRGAEELIVPTRKVSELMQSYNVKPDINIIPTGIDLERFKGRDSEEEKAKRKKALGIPKDDKVAIYIGRVAEEKNIDEIMGYFESYMDVDKNVTFLVIGDGPYKSTLEKKAKQYQNHKKIIFAGSKPWDEITHYYQLADVFVSASTSETQGLTYIEALASGVPVVARKDECLEGVLEDGYNGYSFVDEDGFVSGIHQVFENPANVDFEKNAILSVDKFSTEQFATRVENIYYHVIKSHRNILMRMAYKVADKIGYDRTGVKQLGGIAPINPGGSDMDVSSIALGCMRLSNLDKNEAGRLINHALDLGVTLFDHADIYGGGRSEEIFGEIISENKGMRDRMRIQTKCGIRDGFYDFSEAHILTTVDESLKRLHTDVIDILLLHRPDVLMDVDEVGEALFKLHKSGKVRQFGVSNFDTFQIERLSQASKLPLVINQMQFGLGHAGLVNAGIQTNAGGLHEDTGLLDYCMLNKITIQAWSPLQYGMFEGSILDKEKYPELNEALERIAEVYNVTPSAIAAAWILRVPADIQVIAGTTNIEHLSDICKAAGVKLQRKEWYELYQKAGYKLP